MLRLKKERGLSHRQIARSLSISISTVTDCLRRVDQAGLSWPLADDLDERTLEERLYRSPASPSNRTFPNYGEIDLELRRKGVTLQLLWQEYKERTPEGYEYSQFCAHFSRYRRHRDVVMRQDHRAGEKTFVDFSGDGIPITDRVTGKVWFGIASV